VVLALAGTLAVACSSAKGLHAVTPHASVPTAPAQTTTTNPYAVPAVIDAAYVNRVLAALDAAVGDVVRMVVHANRLDPEVMDRLRALYDDEALRPQVEVLAQDSADGFQAYLDHPGNQRSAIIQMVSASSSCIFAHVSRDYRPVVKEPDPNLSDQWIALVPLDPSRDPRHYNATGWHYAYDGFEEDRSVPKNPCAGS
jgi:hypothetical protein